MIYRTTVKPFLRLKSSKTAHTNFSSGIWECSAWRREGSGGTW